MVSVIYPCAVFFKFFRDSAPVIEILEISEKYAVHKQNRIFCSAYPLPAPHHVQLIFRLFEAVFPVSSGNDIKKRDYIEHGNPRKNDTEHTLFDAELIAAGIYEDYPNPEKQRAEKYDRRKPDYKKRLIFAPERKSYRRSKQINEIKRAENTHCGDKYFQYCTACLAKSRSCHAILLLICNMLTRRFPAAREILKLCEIPKL